MAACDLIVDGKKYEVSFTVRYSEVELTEVWDEHELLYEWRWNDKKVDGFIPPRVNKLSDELNEKLATLCYENLAFYEYDDDVF